MKAMFCCKECGETFEDDLPPLWTGLDIWPLCCGLYVLLVSLVQSGAPMS